MQDEMVVIEDNAGDVATSPKTSADNKQTTSVPKAYTEEEVKKATEKAVSDAKAANGREWKATTQRAEAAEARLKEVAEELEQLQRERYERELESLKGKPEQLNVYQEKQVLRQREAELKRERAELNRDKALHKEEIEVAQQSLREARATKVAVAHGVDATLLLTLTDGSPQKMEALAKVLPKVSKTDNTTTVVGADSGVTSGGTGKPSMEQLEAMTPEQYAKYVKERDKDRL